MVRHHLCRCVPAVLPALPHIPQPFEHVPGRQFPEEGVGLAHNTAVLLMAQMDP